MRPSGTVVYMCEVLAARSRLHDDVNQRTRATGTQHVYSDTVWDAAACLGTDGHRWLVLNESPMGADVRSPSIRDPRRTPITRTPTATLN